MRLHFASTRDRLYGREKELAKLNSIYDSVKNGSKIDTDETSSAGNGNGTSRRGPRLVILEGGSGNGKTSLVHHFGVSCCVSTADISGCDSSSRTSSSKRRDESDRSESSGFASKSVKPLKTCCCYVKGKFDEHHQKPYAAFVDAFEVLLADIVRNRHRESESRRIESIRNALEGDDQAQLLLDMMPQISEILSESSNDKSVVGFRSHSQCPSEKEIQEAKALSPVARDGGLLEQQHQFRFRFQAFVRAVCNDQPQPIILFLDDLQWADVSSLELLKAVLNDSKSTNLIVIVTYRGQVVAHDHHPSRESLLHLKNSLNTQGRYYELTLSDFGQDDLNAFVADSMELAPEKTISLSQVIMRKTHGNIFHSKEFLKHLEAEKLLCWSMKVYHWTWDVDKISGQTDVSENVVDLVAARIRQLPSLAVSILKIASCLWCSFEVAVLEFIVMQARAKLEEPDHLSLKPLVSFGKMNADKRVSLRIQSEVAQALQLGTQQGLLDPMGATSYKFAHDKIREATYSLIEEGDERDNMHFLMGELLWRMFHSKKSQQWMLFSSVDQLNKISSKIDTSQMRQQIAKVNLEAAECATSLSAFLPAITYLKSGIEFLGKSRWTQDYKLCLKLYSKLAALQFSLGYSTGTAEVVEEAIKRAVSFQDKLPLLTTLVESLSVQGKLKESLDLGFEVLDGLGERFPLNAKGRSFERFVCQDKATTAKLLSNHTDATILALPVLTCKKKQWALRLLNLIIDPAFHTGQLSKLYLIINRMVRISVLNGLGRSSGVAFALYGFSLSSENGNRRDNYRYGRLAVTLQERLISSEYDCRVLTYVYVLLNHWQEPLGKSLTPLLTAHHAGMKSGDIDYAFQAAGAYLTLYWYSGRDLGPVLKEAQRFMSQMEEYKHQKTLTIYRPLLQCMLNISSNDYKYTMVLKEEEASGADFEEETFASTTLMSYQMQLAYYFGDLELAETISSKLQVVSKSFNAHYLFVARLFFFGMIALRIAFGASGRRRRWRQLSIARKVIKEMEQWTRHGGLNCLHKLLILKAELQAFRFTCTRQPQRSWKRRKVLLDFETVRGAFENAIAVATRTGFRNDAALAAERAAAFCQRCNQTFLGESFYSQAIQFYGEWGALAKVEQLNNFRTDDSSIEFDLSRTADPGTETAVQRLSTINHNKLDLSHLEESHSRISSTLLLFESFTIRSNSDTDATPEVSNTTTDKRYVSL